MIQMNQLQQNQDYYKIKLNELVAARKKHKKGSAEYAEIQNKINKASARVMTTLEELTNPNQFDEKPTTNQFIFDDGQLLFDAIFYQTSTGKKYC